MSNGQDLIEFVIISFIIITLMFNSGVILPREIRCLPLLGVKKLT